MNIFSNDGYSQGRLIFYDLSQSVEGRKKIQSALEKSKWEDKQEITYILCTDIVNCLFSHHSVRLEALLYIGNKLKKYEDDDADHERVNRAFQKMIQGTFKSNVDKYQAKVNRGIESALNFDFLKECGSDEELGAISTRLEEDQSNEEPVAIYQAREPMTTPRAIADELASALAAATKKREAPAVEESEVLPVEVRETPVVEESEAPPVQEREIPPVHESEAPAAEELIPPTSQEERTEPPEKKKTRKSLFQRMFSPIGKWLSSLFNWFKNQISKIFGHKNS